MTNWIPFSTNLPNVIINELEINYAENKIYAGTYGRGLWSSPLINLNPDNTTDQEQAKIQLYPNPAKDHINLVLDNDKNGLYTIEVYNIHGKRIRKVSAVSTNKYQMNLAEIPDGTYFVRVSNKSGGLQEV